MLHFLLGGGTSLIMAQFDAELFCRMIQKYRLKGVNVVPPIVVFLAKHPLVAKFDLSSLVMVGSGAAPLGADLTAELQKRLPHIKFIVQGERRCFLDSAWKMGQVLKLPVGLLKH